MREVIGHTEIASALAEGRAKIETDTQTLLQQILDSYGSGIEITQVQLQKVDPPAPVIDAFRDVQSAKIDQQRLDQRGAGLRATTWCRVAHGDAARIVQEAQAYKAQVVLQAQGDAARFISVYKSYKAAQDVTARRLYIETMESDPQEHQQDDDRQGRRRARACCPICRCRRCAPCRRRRRRRQRAAAP